MKYRQIIAGLTLFVVAAAGMLPPGICVRELFGAQCCTADNCSTEASVCCVSFGHESSECNPPLSPSCKDCLVTPDSHALLVKDCDHSLIPHAQSLTLLSAPTSDVFPRHTLLISARVFHTSRFTPRENCVLRI